MRKLFTLLISLLILTALGVAGYLGYRLMEGTAPAIHPLAEVEAIGLDYRLAVEFKDQGSGLKRISATIRQGNKVIPLATKEFPRPVWWKGSGVTDYRVEWTIAPRKLGLVDGSCTLRIEAEDSSYHHLVHGNIARWERVVQIDTAPPVIDVLSQVHNIRKGGAGLVAFRVNEPVTRAGVRVGDGLFFPAYQTSEGGSTYLCLMALPFDYRGKGPLYIEAYDAAGNKGLAGFPHRILPRRIVQDRINISDGFLQRKMPDFIRFFPELQKDFKALFLRVNQELRKKNNARLASICSGSQTPTMLWKGRFRQLPNSVKRAGFADHRTYLYHGKKIDEAYHLGLDLASIKRAQVPAANDGTVIFADYLGIYGNTVVIDHGLGLCSSYSHLSAMEVKPGDQVAKGDVIGRTGMTGLAGGDHLHFGMLVNGVFVDPMEWLDAKWIPEHIVVNIPH